MKKKLKLALLTVVLYTGSMAVYATPISATDEFTGATINSIDGINGNSSFDGSDVDPNFVTFFNDVGAGNVASLEFTSTTLVALDGIRLYAANDGALLGFRRSMSHFRFLADTDNDNIFETVLVDQAINIDYNSGQSGDVRIGVAPCINAKNN